MKRPRILPPDVAKLAARLREARWRASLTQQQAADRCGESVKQISAWECGNRTASMNVINLIRLLDAYRIPVAYFFSAEFDRVPWGSRQ